jgi:hypothetical protein
MNCRRGFHRRIGNLEAAFGAAMIPDYPPLSRAEIEEVARRARDGENFTRAELQRLEQHSPVIHREILVVCHGGRLNVKRYPGVDLADV